MHENRETSGAPRPERERGRSAKAQSHTPDAYALEESDRAILSMNQTNKEERSSAEPGEKKARAKENIVQSDTSPTQCGEVSVPRIVRCVSSSIARQSSKVGAVCGSAARTVLCGGRSVMIVPTATYGASGSIRVYKRHYGLRFKALWSGYENPREASTEELQKSDRYDSRNRGVGLASFSRLDNCATATVSGTSRAAPHNRSGPTGIRGRINQSEQVRGPALRD